MQHLMAVRLLSQVIWHLSVYQSATGQGEMAVKAAIDLANGGDLSGFKGVTKWIRNMYGCHLKR